MEKSFKWDEDVLQTKLKQIQKTAKLPGLATIEPEHTSLPVRSNGADQEQETCWLGDPSAGGSSCFLVFGGSFFGVVNYKDFELRFVSGEFET